MSSAVVDASARTAAPVFTDALKPFVTTMVSSFIFGDSVVTEAVARALAAAVVSAAAVVVAFGRVLVVESVVGSAFKVHFCCSLFSSQGCMEIELVGGPSGISRCKQWLFRMSPSRSRPVSGSNLQRW